ncbi:MAG: hypothetical protein PHQ43_00035 [Dehalococcoidales bacterium]|nr:hypothetical protein [Dehalococcoidales bacterium]
MNFKLTDEEIQEVRRTISDEIWAGKHEEWVQHGSGIPFWYLLERGAAAAQAKMARWIMECDVNRRVTSRELKRKHIYLTVEEWQALKEMGK